MRTAALILAAGGSSRLGEPKQLVDWNGKPLLQHVVEGVLAWPVDAVYVVLGSGSEQILESVDLSATVVVENPGWEEGMASSLRVGLDALSNESDLERAFVVLADEPQDRRQVAERLIEAQKRSRKPVVVPRYRYTWGHPVLIDRSLWPRLMAGLEGDRGPKAMFQAHQEWVEEVWFEDLPPRDIDTPFDLDELRPRPRPG